MAKYEKIAKEANQVASSILDMVPKEDRPQVAERLARLFNLGIRVSPRGVQHTVRYRAVSIAMEALPVFVSMEKRTDQEKGHEYHALITRPIGCKEEEGDENLHGAWMKPRWPLS